MANVPQPATYPFRYVTPADLQDPNLGNLNQALRDIWTAVQNQSQKPVNPAAANVLPNGSTPQSLTTAFTFVTSGTQVTFYWDGTNGSKPLTILLNNGGQLGPFFGNFTVGSLTKGVTYYFYPFYQLDVADSDNFGGQGVGVNWARVAGGVGTPPVAYSTQELIAAQEQISADHIPLAVGLATTGVLIPTSGTSNGSGGAGGGGAGGGGGKYLPTP